MSKNSHMVLRKKDNILEVGWDELDVSQVKGVLCLTKPGTHGSLNRPHHYRWTIWNLEKKDEVAQFSKYEDAITYIAYFEFRSSMRS